MTLPTTTTETDLSQFKGHPVELETFHGPLDLLLHLIKKDRIEIWEISISRITRQYLEYLSTLRALNIEVAGEFLVMAATLMRIKSQNLLPRPSFLPEEEDEEPLTREDLIERLVEYRKFREAARAMSGLEWAQARKHPRGAAAVLERGHALPLREPKLIDLAEYLEDLLSRREPPAGHAVHLEEIRLTDQIEWIDRWLQGQGECEDLPDGQGWGFRFSRLLRQPGMRLEVVVTFLAVLELARLQRLRAHQPRALAEIWLAPRVPGPDAPRAGESAFGEDSDGPAAGPDPFVSGLDQEDEIEEFRSPAGEPIEPAEQGGFDER